MTQFLTCNSYIPPYMAYPRFLMNVDISETAKLVYILLLDRARLSMKNREWQDESGCVFVLYTIPNLARDIGKGETTVKKALNQLVKQRLILKQSLGLGQPNKIYVTVPAGDYGKINVMLSSTTDIMKLTSRRHPCRNGRISDGVFKNLRQGEFRPSRSVDEVEQHARYGPRLPPFGRGDGA